MKNFILILYLFTLNIFTVDAQELAEGELIIDFIDLPKNWAVTVNIQAVGTHWDCNHLISNQYSGGSKIYPPSSTHPSDACWHYQGFNPPLAIGLYEITLIQAPPYDYWVQFWIDWRTSDLPPGSGEWIDQHFIYSLSENDIWRYNDPNHSSINGLTLNIWDENEEIEYNPEDLEPFPPTNLIQMATYGAPHLQWQHPGISYHRTGYKIYRSLGSLNNFSPIGNTSENENTYIDNGLILNGGGTVYYKVTTVNGNMESVFSNIIEVSIVEMGKIKQNNDIITQPINNLEQNYPNPFNPSTTITFSLKEKSFTTLKVFDMLGREMVNLLSKELGAGNHKVQFDGSNFKSGIYFYEIRTNEFRDAKKLILVK
jgi:hypothetical protein